MISNDLKIFCIHEKCKCLRWINDVLWRKRKYGCYLIIATFGGRKKLIIGGKVVIRCIATIATKFISHCILMVKKEIQTDGRRDPSSFFYLVSKIVKIYLYATLLISSCFLYTLLLKTSGASIRY